MCKLCEYLWNKYLISFQGTRHDYTSKWIPERIFNYVSSDNYTYFQDIRPVGTRSKIKSIFLLKPKINFVN